MPELPMITNARPLVRRNEACRFCASGIKFKRCHGAPVKSEALGGFRFAGHPHERPTLFSAHTVTAPEAAPTERAQVELPHKDWFRMLRHPSARNARRLASRSMRHALATRITNRG